MYLKTSFLSAAMLFAVPSVASATDSSPTDEQAVSQAVSQFYSSLNTLFTGDAQPMLQVWSHADDVTFLGPEGGFIVGWEDVKANWEKQAALKLGGQIEPVDSHLTFGQDLAIYQCYEKGNNVTADGKIEEVSIRATSVLRKENGQWKVISHQTDLLPFLEAESLTSSQE